MEPLVTDGAPKERVTAFFRLMPEFAQYTTNEIAAATDLTVKQVSGVVTSLLKQDRLAGEERDGTKYYRWTTPR